jgi:hypothetical protein
VGTTLAVVLEARLIAAAMGVEVLCWGGGGVGSGATTAMGVVCGAAAVEMAKVDERPASTKGGGGLQSSNAPCGQSTSRRGTEADHGKRQCGVRRRGS